MRLAILLVSLCLTGCSIRLPSAEPQMAPPPPANPDVAPPKSGY